ncbi:E3 ubiquitin/ISG15 ligase TRIM25-like [Ranitomeya variabilis]|uniref:E3 ubiquitin/ISG15 ligase TRIM25-like n=1 Tax=Ranitomeya variabilis TaxID=490064 RepID=UPI004056F402
MGDVCYCFHFFLLPSAMASAGLEKELECSICMDIYEDPVTLRCGHNFCWDCIDQNLNVQEESGVYSCPECREEFEERPDLQRNITLCNVVENFLSTEPYQEEITGICCTYCVDSPLPAVKTCLHCEVSLCDNHLRVHSKEPKHVLTDPTTSLETRKCSVHHELLKYYCTVDAACVCVSCCVIGEHKGHKLESLDEASEKKKKKLRNVLQKLNIKREKAVEEDRCLKTSRRKAQDKASGEAERVNSLFIDIMRQVDNLKNSILSEIFWREDQESLSDVIQKLEIKKDQLSRNMRHIEELCNMTDPLTVLQDPDVGALCDYEGEDGGDEATGEHDGGDEDTGEHDGGDEDGGGHNGDDEDTDGLDGSEEHTEEHDEGDEDKGEHDGGDEYTEGHDGSNDTGGHGEGDEDTGGHGEGGDTEGHGEGGEDTGRHDGHDYTGRHDGHDYTGSHDGGDRGAELISHISHTLSAMIRDINVIFHGQDPADILLDVNTAANNLLISDDLKTATWTRIRQNRPETAERFQYHQVMSGRRFTSGRHYWDVEISRSVMWRVGMCYPSIDRRGRQTRIGNNNKSWGLYSGMMFNNQSAVSHDGKIVKLPHQISSDRFRICLDYEAGQLSFYELCDPIRHLHTFTATFSEPLHAALWVCGSSMMISGGEAVRSCKRRRICLENGDIIG